MVFHEIKDTMAIVRVKGKPTFFITMIMNIKCHEVMDLLILGESPYDRLYLILQLYEMKKNKLMDNITKGGIFEVCNGHVDVIEFQKRGAPHCQMLIWIKRL